MSLSSLDCKVEEGKKHLKAWYMMDSIFIYGSLNLSSEGEKAKSRDTMPFLSALGKRLLLSALQHMQYGVVYSLALFKREAVLCRRLMLCGLESLPLPLTSCESCIRKLNSIGL